MILTGKIFKFRYAVDDEVQRPIIVTALSMSDADRDVLLYAESQARAAHGGQDVSGIKVRILAATEIDLETL